jgi:methylmalonyl-CoA mutase N-terminal domain/subunit
MVEDGTQVVVGVNRFRGDVTEAVRHRVVVDPAVEAEQVERLRRLRGSRDTAGTTRALAGVRDAALADANSVPPIIAALRARATVGEIVSTLEDVWGAHQP